jgi:hypothetical protein
MRRRKTGRDGFQGYSPSAARAWDRIFGDVPADHNIHVDPGPSMPAEGWVLAPPTPESPATKPHKSPSTPFTTPLPPRSPGCFCFGDCRCGRA